MIAGTLVIHTPHPPLKNNDNHTRFSLLIFPRFKVRASSSSQGKYVGPKPNKDLVADWVKNNDDTVRSLPTYVGGGSLLAVLVNRTLSGIAPVADASRFYVSWLAFVTLLYCTWTCIHRKKNASQSRADLLTLALAVTNILAGLVWLSIRPKTISVVNPQGVECRRLYPQLPDYVVSELQWVWESLSAVTCCRSLVVVYDGNCVFQTGITAESPTKEKEAVAVETGKLIQGSLYQGVRKSGAQSYLANLSLYPGKSQLPFLPSNTQAVILQPLGDKGIAIVGGDTIRGFTTSDQAWITLTGEKLDSTLSKHFTSLPVAVQEAA